MILFFIKENCLRRKATSERNFGMSDRVLEIFVIIPVGILLWTLCISFSLFIITSLIEQIADILKGILK